MKDNGTKEAFFRWFNSLLVTDEGEPVTVNIEFSVIKHGERFEMDKLPRIYTNTEVFDPVAGSMKPNIMDTSLGHLKVDRTAELKAIQTVLNISIQQINMYLLEWLKRLES